MPTAPEGFSDLQLKQFNKAVAYVVKNDGKVPSANKLQKVLRCKSRTARQIAKTLAADSFDDITGASDEPVATPAVATPANKPSLAQTDDTQGDKRVISAPKTRIHTQADAIKFFEIDEEQWEVERFVCNKWDMGFVQHVERLEYPDAPTTTDAVANANNNEPVLAEDGVTAPTKRIETFRTAGQHELYQVKLFLRRKRHASVEGYVAENSTLRSQIAKLRLDVGRERVYAKRLATNHAGFDDVLAGMKEFMDVVGDWQLPYDRIAVQEPQINITQSSTPVVRDGHTEDAVMLWSDQHFGDRIKREDTSGFPEYDVTIAGNRWGYIIGKAKQVLTLHRTMYPIKKLYIWVGGDVGNGVLHDSPNSNELFPMAQIHFSYHMLKFALEDLLQLTVPDEQGRVVIEEIVLLFTVGNHMRFDEKMPHKYQAQRTGDWLIYQMVIERFQSHPKVRIHSEMSPFIFENIRGHRHLFSHGMQVGYRNSPDAQNKAISNYISASRALFDSPEWRRKNGLEGATFARACIGDIHVPIHFPRFVSNGSLNGQNELGVNWQLEPIPAGQQLWGVADKHQETFAYFLECSHIQREKEHFNAYGTFAASYTKNLGR